MSASANIPCILLDVKKGKKRQRKGYEINYLEQIFAKRLNVYSFDGKCVGENVHFRKNSKMRIERIL